MRIEILINDGSIGDIALKIQNVVIAGISVIGLMGVTAFGTYSLLKTYAPSTPTKTNITNLSNDKELPVQSQIKEAAQLEKNQLEDAIDPYNGSKEKWSEFLDNGGLNTQDNFYGVPIKRVSVQFKEYGNNEYAVLYVDESVAPKKIREALNKACKTEESDWTKTYTLWTATKGNVECDFISTNMDNLNGSDGSHYNLSIKVKSE